MLSAPINLGAFNLQIIVHRQEIHKSVKIARYTFDTQRLKKPELSKGMEKPDIPQTEEHKLTSTQIMLIIGVILSILVLAFLSDINSNNGEKPSQLSTAQTPPESAEVMVDASTLTSEYNSNEIAADQKYKGKLVEVTGRVDSISKDITGAPYVSLREEYSFEGVQCMFERENEGILVNLAKGDFVTLRGQVAGFSIGQVVLRGCALKMSQ